MKFGIFYEHQLPRPRGEGDEYRSLDAKPLREQHLEGVALHRAGT